MQMNELGFYTLAGSPSRRASSSTRCAAARPRLGSCFISERFNVKEAATLSGAAGAVVERDRHRDRRHQPEHAPPDGHRRVRDDDAPADGRPLLARPRPRHRR